jgi:hypothetical protein
MSAHIIHKQKVILNVESMNTAFAYQNTVSNLFAGDLTASIENLLDEIDTLNTVTRIEKLTLDLGAINAAGFSDGFKDKLLVELKNSIRSAWDKYDGNTTVIKQSESLRDGFMYFMKKGILPWYIEVRNMAEFEASVLDKWNEQDWIFIVDWFRDNINSYNQITERLVWQFSDKFLKQVLSSALKQIINDSEWKILLNDLLYLNTKLNINKNQTSKEYLTKTFSRVFYQNKSYTLHTLIADELLYELKNKNAELLVKHYGDLINSIQTPFVATIIKNVYFFHEKKISLEYVTAKDVLIKDEKLLDNFSLNDDFKTSSSVKELKTDKYQKAVNKKESAINKEDVLFAENCGIILLHPFLQSYFEELSLIKNKGFISGETQKRCVFLLYYLSTGLTEVAEFNLVLEKMLCGYNFEESLPLIINLTQQEIDESAKLLSTVINYWPPLKNTSIEGLQKTFLQREGKLEMKETGWQLTIEQKTADILLSKLPWGFSTIKLPWMKNMLSVDWC